MAMTRTDHLLTCLAEECMEVAQRVTKALRFGLEEVQPGQDLTNAERICQEFQDLIAVYSMLGGSGVLPFPDEAQAKKKLEKVEKFLAYSDQQGRLSPG